jgi:hypothetical protein
VKLSSEFGFTAITVIDTSRNVIQSKKTSTAIFVGDGCVCHPFFSQAQYPASISA